MKPIFPTPHLVERYRNNAKEVLMVPTSTISAQAGLAASLIERWGMVAACPDGEDEAGRAKVRPLTPQEIVDRACETAEAAYEAFHARGWVMPIPDPYLEAPSSDDDSTAP